MRYRLSISNQDNGVQAASASPMRAGSVALGVLYEHYIWGLVAVSVVASIAAIPAFFIGSVESGMGS